MINHFLGWSGSALRTDSGFSPENDQLALKELVPVHDFTDLLLLTKHRWVVFWVVVVFVFVFYFIN